MTSDDVAALGFAAHLSVTPIAEQGLVASGERGVDAYAGEIFARVGEIIDGTQAREAVLAAFGESERAEAEEALTTLIGAGIVVEAAAGGVHRDGGWWSSLGVAPGLARERLAAATVEVRALGGTDATAVADLLQTSGVRVGSEGATLTVVLVDDYLTDELAEINEQALECDRPWLLARPGRAIILVGPVFESDRGPCWECLAQRLRLNQRHCLNRVWPAVRPRSPEPTLPVAASGIGSELIATELVRWLAEGASNLAGTTVLSLDSRGWRAERHRVVWRPQCPACGVGGPPEKVVATPIELGAEAGSTSFVTPDLRAADPHATLRRYEHHVSSITGAVATLERRNGPDVMHTYLSGGPVARVHGTAAGWERWAGQYSAGKGTSDIAARAGALCEALERYSGRFSGDEPRRMARAGDLGDAAILPNVYMNFSERQFAGRDESNARLTGSLKSWVPERYDPAREIAWSPVWSLSRQTERWLPTALCYSGAAIPGHEVCVAESNGNAAGNTLAEAILHGVLELVERDHVALWWYNRVRRPAVELDTIAEPWLQALREHLLTVERELWVLDLTADLGICAAAAVSCGNDGGDVRIGFGAHLGLGGAAVRAVTELVQLGLGAPSGGLGTGPRVDLRADPGSFLRPEPSAAESDAAADPESPQVALDRVRTAIERRGLELLVLDQTRPDIGLPVVKAIVPGLRHFWPRLGPGRLYDVPVELGWLPRPLEENELNPGPPAG